MRSSVKISPRAALRRRLAFAAPLLALAFFAILAMAGADDYEARESADTAGMYETDAFRYLLMRPKAVEPGVMYPLVVFLHGAGERGDDPEVLKRHFLPLMASDEMRERFPCFVVAPQCPSARMWVFAAWGEKESRPMTPEPVAAMRAAMRVVDETVGEFPIDEDRIYLTGISMGGYGAWDWAIRQPDRFAAVAPICGGGDESQAARLVGVPVWAFHGEFDDAVPVVRSRRMIDAIRAAGGDPNYTEYPGVGHGSWTPAYHDSELIPWLFAQRRVTN